MSEMRGEGLCLWFTGLSGAGKTTLCCALRRVLEDRGVNVCVLDAEECRRTISRDLGFSRRDRDENVARIAALAGGLVRRGVVVLVAAISPYREARDEARRTIGRFVEVYVDASVAVCIERDTKGHYARALRGELRSFTGIDDPYEAPVAAEIWIDAGSEDVAGCVERLAACVERELGRQRERIGA